MKRPKLNEMDLNPVSIFTPGQAMITMDIGQWDGFLESAYENGFVLLELDESETPVKAYWKGCYHRLKMDPPPTEMRTH